MARRSLKSQFWVVEELDLKEAEKGFIILSFLRKHFKREWIPSLGHIFKLLEAMLLELVKKIVFITDIPEITGFC